MSLSSGMSARGWVSNHSTRAVVVGSTPAFSHHAASSPQRWASQMVGVCRPAPTNQARLFGHELDVLLVTKAARFRMGKPALVNAIGSGCSGGPYRLPRA